MVGDTSDIVARLKLLLPRGWFGDQAPILDAVLGGIAEAWSTIYLLLEFVKSQTRIATASGMFLDIMSADYLGGRLPRRLSESDITFSARIRANILAPRGTRAGVVQALVNLTGREPIIFEPLNATDTGGYNVNLGYNLAGGYGSFDLPYQFFITAYRADSSSENSSGGYDGGPGGYNAAPISYGDMQNFYGTISDDEIYNAIAEVLPVCSIAWTKLSN
jgi:hypothetical protein